MTNKTEILTFLSDNKKQLFCEYQLVKIGLFGSFSKNEETKDSDIDLIVEFEPNTKNLSEKKHKIKNFIKKKFNRKVNLCREKYIKPYFKSQILKSVIYIW